MGKGGQLELVIFLSLPLSLLPLTLLTHLPTSCSSGPYSKVTPSRTSGSGSGFVWLMDLRKTRVDKCVILPVTPKWELKPQITVITRLLEFLFRYMFNARNIPMAVPHDVNNSDFRFF